VQQAEVGSELELGLTKGVERGSLPLLWTYRQIPLLGEDHGRDALRWLLHATLFLARPFSDVPDVVEGAHTRVAGGGAELLLDAQQPVVFGDPLAACRRAALDLTGVRGDDEVGDRRVLCLAAAVADDRGEAEPFGKLDRRQRFGEGADLVQLDQYGVAGVLIGVTFATAIGTVALLRTMDPPWAGHPRTVPAILLVTSLGLLIGFASTVVIPRADVWIISVTATLLVALSLAGRKTAILNLLSQLSGSSRGSWDG